MYDADGKQVPSPASIADEAADRAFHEKCARQLQANEWDVPQPSGVTQSDFDNALKFIGEAIGKELRKLRDRIVVLEAERTLRYVGAWKVGGDYNPGEFVSYGGGIWHCKQHTGTRPNQCHEAWTLAVKSGAK